MYCIKSATNKSHHTSHTRTNQLASGKEEEESLSLKLISVLLLPSSVSSWSAKMWSVCGIFVLLGMYALFNFCLYIKKKIFNFLILFKYSTKTLFCNF